MGGKTQPNWDNVPLSTNVEDRRGEGWRNIRERYRENLRWGGAAINDGAAATVPDPSRKPEFFGVQQIAEHAHPTRTTDGDE